jgi:hypothetical protein
MKAGHVGHVLNAGVYPKNGSGDETDQVSGPGGKRRARNGVRHSHRIRMVGGKEISHQARGAQSKKRDALPWDALPRDALS